MEDRLGKAGRLFATVLIVLVALGIAAWMIDLIYAHMINPIINVVRPLLEGKAASFNGTAVASVTVAVIVSGLFIGIVAFLFNKAIGDLRLRASATGKLASSTYHQVEELEERLKTNISRLESDLTQLETSAIGVQTNFSQIIGVLKDVQTILMGLSQRVDRLEERVDAHSPRMRFPPFKPP